MKTRQKKKKFFLFFFNGRNKLRFLVSTIMNYVKSYARYKNCTLLLLYKLDYGLGIGATFGKGFCVVVY